MRIEVFYIIRGDYDQKIRKESFSGYGDGDDSVRYAEEKVVRGRDIDILATVVSKKHSKEVNV